MATHAKRWHRWCKKSHQGMFSSGLLIKCRYLCFIIAQYIKKSAITVLKTTLMWVKRTSLFSMEIASHRKTLDKRPFTHKLFDQNETYTILNIISQKAASSWQLRFVSVFVYFGFWGFFLLFFSFLKTMSVQISALKKKNEVTAPFPVHREFVFHPWI